MRNYGAPRFNEYSEIKAKFDSQSTDCGGEGGHAIAVGEVIGYCRRGQKAHTHCAGCWAAWANENAQADVYEAGLGGGW